MLCTERSHRWTLLGSWNASLLLDAWTQHVLRVRDSCNSSHVQIIRHQVPFHTHLSRSKLFAISRGLFKGKGLLSPPSIKQSLQAHAHCQTAQRVQAIRTPRLAYLCQLLSSPYPPISVLAFLL